MPVVGQTRTSGFQIGVSRTFQCTPERAWKVLFSRAGRRIWLNTNKPIPTQTGSPYRTIDGIYGEIRSYYDAQKIRLTWQPPNRSTDTTVQVTVTGKAGKTALRFHQERLKDAKERATQRDHWLSMLEALGPLLNS